MSGGVASLNHRLMAFIPPGWKWTNTFVPFNDSSPPMNASPDFTAQPVVMWILIPALICLFGIVIGIVAAFRHGDARVPLGIGGLAFVAILFSLPFASTPVMVQSSPTAFDHSASPPMPTASGFPPTWIMLLVPALMIGTVAVAAFRHNDRVVRQMVLPVIATSVCLGGVVALMYFLSAASPYANSMPEPNTPAEPPWIPGDDASRQIGQSVSVKPTPPPVVPTGPAPNQILYTSGNAQPISIQELPGWRKNPPHEGVLGAGRAKYVLTSQQFATVDEAEAELFQSLTVDVQESFAKYHSPAVGWTPTPEDLRLSGIIAERVVETFSVKVGEFENPVHRVSWLIEFDHDKNTVLLKRWEPIEAQRRSKLILSILAGASGVLGVAAMALRRRRNQPTPEAAPANSLA